MNIQKHAEPDAPLLENDEPEDEAFELVDKASHLHFQTEEYMGWRCSWRRGCPEQHHKQEPSIVARLARTKRNLASVASVLPPARRHRAVKRQLYSKTVHGQRQRARGLARKLMRKK